VFNTFISAMECLVLTANEFARLDAQICLVGRRALSGEAFVANFDTEVPKYTTISNDEVRRRLDVSPVRARLRQLRLKWFQEMVRHPFDNASVLASIFGKSAVLDDALDEDGEVLPSAHPWLLQLVDDLTNLFERYNEEDLLAAVRSPLMLFVDECLRDRFLALDVQLVGAAARAVCIPPPGAAPAEFPPDPERPFRCPYVVDPDGDGGHLCDKWFRNKRDVIVHAVHKHGLRVLPQAIVAFNQCPACRAIFATRGSAQQHLRHSLFRGFCRADAAGSSTVTIVNTSSLPVHCGLCDVWFSTLVSAQWHFCTHLPDSFSTELAGAG
jgi:hypothetical protein